MLLRWITLGAVTVSSAWMGAACDEAKAPPSAPAAGGGDSTATSARLELPFELRFDREGRFISNANVKPAYRVNKTFEALKGDQYDNTRAKHPEYYAITEPPARTGIRPMVEWEPMRAIAMAFPGDMLSSTNATQTVVQIAKVGSDYGEVWIAVDGAQAENGLRTRMTAAGMSAEQLSAKVKFFRTDLDSIWFIDAGPLPIVDPSDNTYAFADFRYYHERALDDALPTIYARNLPTAFGRPSPATVYRMPLTVEGGTFQATTEGVCVTGSREIWNLSCYAGACDDAILTTPLADLQTNPYTVAMEGTLRSYTGCKDLVVTNSISDDGTGHIDMYLKILADDRILVGQYDSASTNAYERENAVLMDDNVAFLQAYVRPNGEHFTVRRLPMPGHRSATGTGSVPFTYINSTIFNGVNLWPATVYANWTASRDAAQAVWDEVLPDHENVWIDATELSFYSGAIHCITRTIPDKTESAWVADGSCDTSGGNCVAPEHGYDDECRPAGLTEDICWGPAWLCGCNDCESGCTGGTADACKGVPYEGCCDSGDVMYCDGGQLYRQTCGNTGCGWNPFGGYYDCQQSGSDPSGDFPITCASCTADCSGKLCGDDGCGGSCGSCDGGAACVDGECRSDCAVCTPGEIGCDGDVAWLCNAGQGGCNTKQTVDCAGQGKTCSAGDCVVGAADPGAEPSPEVAAEASPEVGPEPSPEVAVETSGADATSAGDGAGSDALGTDTGARVSTGHQSDCAAGGGDSALGLGAAGLALGWMAMRRRGRRADRLDCSRGHDFPGQQG
ncbi:MAG: agmatine deiminase family protein [Myxococcota bacterium]